MPLQMTIHEAGSVMDASGRQITILGKQIGGESLTVSATAVNSAPVTQHCLVAIKAGENCMIRISTNATTNIANSFPLSAGERDIRLLHQGQFVSVIAA